MAPSNNHIEKVAIVGAGGNCGVFITEALLKTGKHVVTAITRAESTSKLPDGVEVKKVDYANPSSLVEALRGQDALIITMAVTAPPDTQTKLIEAAAEANVPWVFPNEWGLDAKHESLDADIVIGAAKKAVREQITKLGKSSWIGVATGFWYEWSLSIKLGYGFDLANRAVTFYDEGDTLITTSTWPQVGRAMASLLSLPIQSDGKGGLALEKYRHDFVNVSSFTVSQKDMLDSVLRVTKTTKEDWTITKVPSAECYATGMAQMKAGDRMGFVKLLYSRCFYPNDSGNMERTGGLANDALGLPKENIDEFTKIAITRVEEGNTF